VKIVSLGNVAAALRHTQICLVRAGEVGVRDRLVAADGFYTIGGMLEDEVIYADAYPRRIPHESGSVRRPNVPGGMLQGLPLSSFRRRLPPCPPTTPRGPAR
jgi:hypothetical protein